MNGVGAAAGTGQWQVYSVDVPSSIITAARHLAFNQTKNISSSPENSTLRHDKIYPPYALYVFLLIFSIKDETSLISGCIYLYL